MVKWYRCDVIGTGKEGDSYRPSLIEAFEKKKQKIPSWSAVYYPKNPPYEYCIVRIETEHEADKKEVVLDRAKLKEECDRNSYFRYRWLDQPDYPAKGRKR